MRAKVTYIIVALLAVASCTKNDDLPQKAAREIVVEVVDTQAPQTRALLLNQSNEIIQQGEFALNAYLKSSGNPYFEDAWVYYFTPDNDDPLWCFRDTEGQQNLINFYWPNDDNVNFIAYMPRNAASNTNGSCVVEDIKYDNQTSSVTFAATLPSTITDKTVADREAENKKLEFVYAARLDQGRNSGDVKLRFVHPFAAIHFDLWQSHRDLTIHWIKFNDIAMSGNFSSNADTYDPWVATTPDAGQSYLTYSNWTPNNDQTKEFKIELEKNVPNDINYDQPIGGPYLVMPQALDDVTMSISYTWNGVTKTAENIAIKTDGVPAWNPGKEYTYYLNLGDNKEEILFMITVEPWAKGEDDGYENNYDVE